MKRRHLLTGVIGLAWVPSVVLAAPESSTSAEPSSVTMTGMGLPIIVQGRVVNHVFVELRLNLKPGHPPEQVRAHDAAMRDALIRAGHRTPFILAHDYNRINTGALSTALMRIASQQLGAGIVTGVEVVRQTPRMRVRNPAPAPRSS